ncbi:MAG TPA: glycosyltransferase [Methylomirabilota bacterium]|nr:glycosyltransferase [Methylomirabilota bacterium]
MSEDGRHGFVDAVAAAFLRRRLHSRRLRAAAVRGLKGISAGPGDGLRMEFDHAASCLVDVPPWLAAHTSEVASAPAPPTEPPRVPSMSIVVMAVGSRGDVQPFIPIGRRLAQRHRVRIATHREFRPMVERAGLEFYPLEGNPHELMEYIVRTGGSIVPTRLHQIWEDVPKKRAMIAEILASTWRACTELDPEQPGARPFRADAIVANPPSYGHMHCAEALHVPLHMIFTMPWSATCAFPHPFARIDPGAHRPVENFLSYGIVDLLVWAGIRDLVDAFRVQTLKLPPIGLTDGAALLEDHEVPLTYLWPASLVPKPADWGPHIDLANFIHYEQAHTYEPPQALLDFLAAGEAPIYVGFGSVVAADPAALTRTIFTALEKAGARGVVSEGWAHLGGAAPPPNVYVVGDCPHDWLFARCRAVCHHGGAGTTAAGLRAGLPTVVVPFFGDQFFWGRIVADAGAGPEPIPIRRLDSENLMAAFDACRRPQVGERARELGARLRATDGVELVVQSIERHLPASAMACSHDPDHLAVVYCDTCGARLCGDCSRSAHSGHAVHPYRYVDWGWHQPHGVAAELGELVGDAAQALQAGLAELLPTVKRARHGVVFSDDDEPSSADDGGPVRKVRRWLASW